MIASILCRFGEIFLKGDNRPFFERKLGEALGRAVAGLEGAAVRALGEI
jgi:adenylyl- and sulfurtransferase ThiI